LLWVAILFTRIESEPRRRLRHQYPDFIRFFYRRHSIPLPLKEYQGISIISAADFLQLATKSE
jgi:hypothetical protein